MRLRLSQPFQLYRQPAMTQEVPA
ncbi:CRISPR-associated protein Cas5 [Draconibacterium orientale]